MRRLASLALTLALLAPGPAEAWLPDEVLADPALESRARDLSAGIRCMVCQNQSIDDSDAPLARDLRLLVRERLEAGDSDGEVLDYLVARYGEFVLMRPRVSAQTAVLWGLPAVLFLGGGAYLLLRARREQRAAPSGLSAEEERRLAALLDRDAKGPPSGA